MEPKVMIVPKGKTVLDVLETLKEKTKKAWVFLHDDAQEDLYESGVYTSNYIMGNPGVWTRCREIDTSDFSYVFNCEDPDYIFFIKMQN